MFQECALIIFARNPVFGQVKSRIAKRTDPETALSIYNQLLAITRENVKTFKGVTFVFYSSYIEQNDIWVNVEKRLQSPDDNLGKCLKAALRSLNDVYKYKIIIGTDCPELSEHIINQALVALKDHDVVIGPAKDGGYYLIGLTQDYTTLFEEIHWGSSEVLAQTLNQVNQLNLSCALLPELHDVDEISDWEQYLSRLRDKTSAPYEQNYK